MRTGDGEGWWGRSIVQQRIDASDMKKEELQPRPRRIVGAVAIILAAILAAAVLAWIWLFYV